eukprot:3034837-Lingulodinium_polyedra.AAC.1
MEGSHVQIRKSGCTPACPVLKGVVGPLAGQSLDKKRPPMLAHYDVCLTKGNSNLRTDTHRGLERRMHRQLFMESTERCAAKMPTHASPPR